MARSVAFLGLGLGGERPSAPAADEERGSRLVVRNTFLELVEAKGSRRPCFRRAKTDTLLLEKEEEDEEYSAHSGNSDADTADEGPASGLTTAESEAEEEHEPEAETLQAEAAVKARVLRGPVPVGPVAQGTTAAVAAPAKAKGRGGNRDRPKTTVMLRNLPNNYTRAMLLELLNEEGFEGKYDFVYLPVDFKSKAGLGYAFVNLVDAEVVPQFWAALDGFSRWSLPTCKVCVVGWSDPHQGLRANVQRYRNSPVMHESVPDWCKPALFTDGVPTPFPKPTKTLQAPRRRARN